jgi:bud site selection protein 20
MPAIRGEKSKKKTRRYARDLDQVHADLRSERHLAQFKDTKAVEDLPGLGQFYCKECAKWFESEANFGAHRKGKVHKRRYECSRCANPQNANRNRRLRQLRDEPYSQKEAEAAAGLGTDNGKRTIALMEVDDSAAA